MDPLSDEKIVQSWLNNASPWTKAVRDKAIESRRLVTDHAIVDAVLERKPGSALDIGCGEGWLARELTRHGVDVVGVDVVPDLIEKAKSAGGGDFRVASYEEIASGALEVEVDVAVANFSLIGEKAVDDLIAAIPPMLNTGGALVIQTLHPVTSTGDQPYANGWRQGSWAGFSEEFTDPAPWYFRTIECWVDLIVMSGLCLTRVVEPLHPHTGKPASLILVAE